MNDGPALTPTEAKSLLVRIMTTGGRVAFRRHAEDEMRADNITISEVFETLTGGVVEPAEWRGNEWRYRVRRQRVYVVVTFEHETHTAVVTAWRRK